MNANMFNRKSFTAVLFCCALFIGGCKDTTLEEDLSAMNLQEAAKSSTAQSVMVEVNVNTSIIDGEEVWNFDQTTGATYFSGGTENQRKNVANAQKCTFYNGGTLDAQTVGGGPNAVTITPITNLVAAKTAWDLSNSVSGSAEVTLDLIIAGQSVVVNKNKAKYSFDLGDNENSRISDLKVEVTGQPDQFPGHTILTDDEEGSCLAEVPYKGNAGTFGSATSSLKTNMTLGEIISLNQFGSTSVCGNAAIAKVDQLVYEVGEGSYTVKVTGIVKGNGTDFTSPQPFEVEIPFTVSAQGCQQKSQ